VSRQSASGFNLKGSLAGLRLDDNRNLMIRETCHTDSALGVYARPVYAAPHGNRTFATAMKAVLEWIVLLSLATSGLCMLSLAVMMVVGRWQHAIRQRVKKRRRALLSSDMHDLETIRLARSETAEAEKNQSPGPDHRSAA
jgi:hypothetical protein